MRSVFLITLALTLVACDSGGTPEETPQYFQAQILLDNVIGLDGGASYEAWAKINNEWTSITRFNYDAQGRLVDVGGRLVSNTFITDFDLQPATEVLISIEDRRDADLTPSDTHVLHGVVAGTSASLTFASAVTDLSGVSADYTIGTPVDSDPSNEAFGFWLGTPGTYQPAMVAPSLGGAWLYELWAEFASGPVSLGKFERPDERDSASPFSAQPETFSVPGEAFVINEPDGETFPKAVAGMTFYVTVEPNPDDFEETPYGIRILEATVPAGASPGVAFSMSPVAATPRGTVNFR